MLNLPKVNKIQEDTFNQEEKGLGRSKTVILNLLLLLLAFSTTQLQASAFTENQQVTVGHNLNMMNTLLKGDVNQGHYSHSSHSSHHSHYSSHSSR